MICVKNLLHNHFTFIPPNPPNHMRKIRISNQPSHPPPNVHTPLKKILINLFLFFKFKDMFKRNDDSVKEAPL